VRRERAAVSAQLSTAERARGKAIGAHARLREASASMERLRARLASATPAERREIVSTVVDPGGVRFVGERLRIELWIERPASSESHSRAFADGASWSLGHEARLRIRLVA
jgi:hypothetical protein